MLLSASDIFFWHLKYFIFKISFCSCWSLWLSQAGFISGSRKTVSICPQPPRNGRHVSLPGEGSVQQPCNNSLLNHILLKSTVFGHPRYTSGWINPSRRSTFSSRAWTTSRERSPFWQGSLAYMRSATYCTSFFQIQCWRRWLHITASSAILPQEMNNIASATEYYKEVLKQDNTHVEAIACIGSNHFYTDQPEIALRFYRFKFAPRELLTRRIGAKFCENVCCDSYLTDVCCRWGCTTASCTTTWACVASTLSSTTWLCPLSRGRWPWRAVTRSRLMSGTILATWLWWVSAAGPEFLQWFQHIKHADLLAGLLAQDHQTG